MVMAQQRIIQGFEKASKHTAKRLIISVEGMEKEGKTSFGLSAPGPIALFDMDIGLEGVIDKWADEKEIYVASFDYRDATSQNEWEAMWNKMRAAYLTALKDKAIRTLVWDTGTEAWELIRLARFGQLAQVMPQHYGPVNAEFRDMIRKVYETDKNLIMLHKMKDEYVLVGDRKTGKSERTGGHVRAGFSDVGYLMQINLRVWRNVETGFGLTVRDCRQNAEIAGMDLMDPLNTFQYLAAEVFQTSPEEWE